MYTLPGGIRVSFIFCHSIEFAWKQGGHSSQGWKEIIKVIPLESSMFRSTAAVFVTRAE